MANISLAVVMILSQAQRRQKLTSIDEAASLVNDGCILGIGGTHSHNSPMAIVRQIIRNGVKDLTLIPGNSGGFQSDILIGAGCVKTVYLSYIGFEYLGMAPNFRRKAEAGELEVKECDEAFVVRGLRAGGSSMAFYPIPGSGHKATGLLNVNPEYRTVKDPYTGQEVVVVPPLKPDVALLHVGRCDPFGNVRHAGHIGVDDLMVEASKLAIVSAEEIISGDETMKAPLNTTIPGFYVNKVVSAPFGAHPGEASSFYEADEEHLKMYLEESRSKEGFQKYLEKYVYGPKNHEQYLEKIGLGKLMSLRRWVE